MIVFIKNKNLIKEIYINELKDDQVAQQKIRLQAQVNEFLHAKLIKNNVSTSMDERIGVTYFNKASFNRQQVHEILLSQAMSDGEEKSTGT